MEYCSWVNELQNVEIELIELGQVSSGILELGEGTFYNFKIELVQLGEVSYGKFQFQFQYELKLCLNFHAKNNFLKS